MLRSLTLMRGGYPTDNWNSLRQTILDTATETLGSTKRRHQDWFDENDAEILQLLKAKNQAHRRSLADPQSQALRDNWRRLRSEAQAHLRRMENEWWVKKATEIQHFADVNDTHNFYNSIKSIYGPSSRHVVPVRSADGMSLIKDCDQILHRWREHFNDLLNRTNPFNPNVLDTLPALPVINELDAPLTLEEVRQAVSSLKNKKSPGPDGIPGELLKYGGPALTERLHLLYQRVWDTGRIPQEWKDANIIAIYKKKGDRAECGNSRGISLLANAGKVLARVLLRRLAVTVAERFLPESQCGFRQGRGTIDMIFVARQIQEKCREQHQDLFLMFIDLTKAFDSVNRELLWSLLQRLGCPPRFLRLIRGFHEGMMAKLVIDGRSSEPFEVKVGVKQGCVLAPVLFNLFVSAVALLSRSLFELEDGVALKYRLDGSVFNLRRLKSDSRTRRAYIYELEYADDKALISHSAEAAQRLLDSVCGAYSSFGLAVNREKTEVLQQPNDAPPNPLLQLQIGLQSLKSVQRFTYLGSILSQSATIDDEVEMRLQKASSAFGRLRLRVFSNHHLTTSTKVAVYRAVVLSILLYGSETWIPHRRHLRVLEAFHIRCLQRILGLSWEDRIPHSTILERSQCLSIESLLVQRTMRWTGHVIRMPESRLPRIVFYGELAGGHRTVGGQKKRYKDHLAAILRKADIEPCHLESLASNRSLWRATTKQAIQTTEEKHRLWLEERRRKRTAAAARSPPTPTTSLPCPSCGRLCRSALGLRSHLRVHNR